MITKHNKIDIARRPQVLEIIDDHIFKVLVDSSDNHLYMERNEMK